MNVKKRSSGFSLIELVITLAILTVLTSISYPSYNQHFENVRKTSAQGDLIELSAFMTRYYSENYSYQTASDGNPTLPMTESPSQGTKYYNLTVVAQDQSYVLTATPKNGQGSDRCGTLTVNHSGVKTAKKNGVIVEGCW